MRIAIAVALYLAVGCLFATAAASAAELRRRGDAPILLLILFAWPLTLLASAVIAWRDSSVVD